MLITHLARHAVKIMASLYPSKFNDRAVLSQKRGDGHLPATAVWRRVREFHDTASRPDEVSGRHVRIPRGHRAEGRLHGRGLKTLPRSDTPRSPKHCRANTQSGNLSRPLGGRRERTL